MTIKTAIFFAAVVIVAIPARAENPIRVPFLEQLAVWAKIHDRVQSGQMPPPDSERPAVPERQAFTIAIAAQLTDMDRQRLAASGRAVKRRLNRSEYEDTLRDLLDLPYLQVKEFLPEDTEAYGFNKSGEALDVSHVQMARYPKAADFALRQAIASQVDRPLCTTHRYYTWNQSAFVNQINQIPNWRRVYLLQGLKLRLGLMDKGKQELPRQDAKVREAGSMGMLMSTYEPTYVQFNEFRAPQSGRYRVRLSASTFWIATDLKSVAAGHHLYISMLQRMGIKSDKFASSTSTMKGQKIV